MHLHAFCNYECNQIYCNHEYNRCPSTLLAINRSKANVAKTPDKAPEISAPDPATYKKKLDQLYWLRIIFAAASGIIATFAFDSIDGEERRWASIIFMIAVYLVTFVIAKSMKMQLPASDKKKIITQAIGSFVFIYLFMWIVSYTLVNIPSAGFDLGTVPLP